MKNKSSKIIICFILVVFIFVSLIVIKHYKSPTEEVVVKTSALRLENTINYTEELEEYIPPQIKELYNVCLNNEEYCKDDNIIIKTESDGAYLIESYKYKYFFYCDAEKVKVFNTSENKSYIIDGMSPDYSLDFIVDSNDNFIGVVYSTNINDGMKYLLLDGNKTIYNGQYDYIISVSPKYLSASKYDKNGNQVGAYIIYANKEEKPLIKKEINTEEYYGFYALGKKYITFEYGKEMEIYDNDSLELLYKSNKVNQMSGDGYPRLLYGVDTKDNIYIYDDKNLSMLDNKGNEIKKSKELINAIDLVDKYLISTDNKELIITDIDNNKIKIASLENGKLDYYTFVNNNNGIGIYFDVYDNKVSYSEVYNSCKNTKCKGVSFEEFQKDYKNNLGYEYFFDYKTSKVTRIPTVIVPTNNID